MEVDLKETVSFHIVIAIFFIIFGYLLFALLTEHNILEIKTLLHDYESVIAEKEKAGILMIFFNNMSFFTLVSILPVLNFVYIAVQFFNMGTYLYQVKELDFLTQFTLLYRHSIFEVVALILSVYISYSLLKLSSRYLSNENPNFPYRKKFIRIGFVYMVVLLLTFVGALLEGNVHVLIQ